MKSIDKTQYPFIIKDPENWKEDLINGIYKKLIISIIVNYELLLFFPP